MATHPFLDKPPHFALPSPPSLPPLFLANIFRPPYFDQFWKSRKGEYIWNHDFILQKSIIMKEVEYRNFILGKTTDTEAELETNFTL